MNTERLFTVFYSSPASIILTIKKVQKFCLSHIKDSGVSGAKESRPELNKLMSEVRAGNVSSVVVYSFSRMARSTKHLLEALSEFEHHGVQFVSITEKLNTSDPMGRAIFTIISALSQLERELISERVKNGLANARAKGKRIGRKKTRNSKLIQELRKQGMSYRKIALNVDTSIATVHRELISN